MMNSPETPATIVDVTMENAQAMLIEASHERPVLVDFWADWCEPCKTLMPLLEKLANEYQGKFLLARVNADELGPIAGQLGVRSLPTLILMQAGQPVDGLVGAQSEQALRALLDKYVKAAWQEDWEQARALLAADADADQRAEALRLLKSSWEASRHAPVAIELADALVEEMMLDDAQALLDSIKLEDRKSDWQRVMAKLELKREAGKSPEVMALEQAFAADPDNLALAQQLAVALSESKHPEDALALLFGLLQRDLNAADGAVKKLFTEIIASLGKGHAVGVQYQRKLYTLLY